MSDNQPPPGSHAQYAQQPPPPPLPGSSSRWGPTSMGINPAIAAGLAYLFGGHLAGILPIIWLIFEKRNRFIRFHAAQSLLGIAAYLVGLLLAGVLFVGAMLIAQASGADSQTAGSVAGSIAIVYIIALTVTALVFEVWGIIVGFSGKFAKFPLIGALAVRLIGGPPVPLY